jgi:hypothetical protein
VPLLEAELVAEDGRPGPSLGLVEAPKKAHGRLKPPVAMAKARAPLTRGL